MCNPSDELIKKAFEEGVTSAKEHARQQFDQRFENHIKMAVLKMNRKGFSAYEIADILSVSTERVEQIIKKIAC